MSDTTLRLRLTDDAATIRLGAALARAMPGARAMPEARAAAGVLYLRGDLGAGKTTCARSLLHALGVTGIVRSPTYTLVETHAAPGLQCVHVDLYRLRGPSDLEDLGLRDYLSKGHLLLIEWPERVETALPPADIDVALAYRDADQEAGRDAHVIATGDWGTAWLANLRKDPRLTSYVANLT
jgi:tRNA threonylcarbamoyladenosine biosynthesis protein TsaE